MIGPSTNCKHVRRAFLLRRYLLHHFGNDLLTTLLLLLPVLLSVLKEPDLSLVPADAWVGRGTAVLVRFVAFDKEALVGSAYVHLRYKKIDS